MEGNKLLEVLEYLRPLDSEDFRKPAMDEYFRHTHFESADFLPFTFFREDTYGRNLVYKNEIFEILVLTWLPRQRTPIHDHNGQRCWMNVMNGELVFKTFPPLTHPGAKLEATGRCATHKVGDSVYIDDGIGVHSIANASHLPAVSVHIYAAPISECRIYDEATRCFQKHFPSYFTEFGGEWEKALQLVRAFEGRAD